ncbi:MAG: Abi family protein [Youngiibacter sp.]|nr:Abi family protein [Youngiibacter sp.]
MAKELAILGLISFNLRICYDYYKYLFAGESMSNIPGKKKRTKRSVDSLMKFMRDEKGIEINGSSHKKKLLNMGYFHGYKGYRFVHTIDDGIPFKDFNEIIAINQFDSNMKELFYKPIMFLETSWKSHCVETCVRMASDDFTKIYDNVLNDYKDLKPSDKKYNDRVKHRFKVRDSIYSTITYKYNKSTILQYYQRNEKPVPIWAIMEIISLGSFGDFLRAMNVDSRRNLLKSLNMYYCNFDGDARLLENTIYCLSTLRNAIAHNLIIFDCRFKDGEISRCVKELVKVEIGNQFTGFNSIVDYLALVLIFLKKAAITKTDRRKIVRSFQNECESLRSSIPVAAYDKILGTDVQKKLHVLSNY